MPKAFLQSLGRIKKQNITSKVSEDNRLFLCLSQNDIGFLHNPMLYMAHKGREITNNFNILALFPLLVEEYYPDEYLFAQSEIADKLNALHKFIDHTMIEVFKVEDMDLYLIEISTRWIDIQASKNEQVISRMLKNICTYLIDN